MLADRYELDHEIGRGGMGAVWLGRDTVLGRTVAIKQIGMVHGGEAPDLDRAEREARLAARVNHENVVAVYDLVFEGAHQWLVMELVDGPSLAGLIAQRGALDPDELLPVVAQVAAALAAAHEHGIVHRDVKPSNILLTHDGIAKLSDFGFARAQADAALTQTGIVTGSAAYLSPEVVKGRTATAASDVWSLGAVVFHALAGHPPFGTGDDLLDSMHRIVNDDPPRLTVEGPLASSVEAMMQRDPDARPTMAEVELSVAGSAAADPEPYGLAAAAPDQEPPTADATGELDLGATQGSAAFDDEPEPTAAFSSEPEPTAAFTPFEEPVTVDARDPAPASVETHQRDNHRRNLWLAGGAAAVIIGVAAFMVIGRDDEPATDRPTAAATSRSAAPTSDAGPTAEAIEGFAADYLTTASNDPEKGFTMLTPTYQQESGGLEGYMGFWGGVSDLDVKTLRGDPKALTVSYTYSYLSDGKPYTEDVTLQLEQSGDSFFISGTV